MWICHKSNASDERSLMREKTTLRNDTHQHLSPYAALYLFCLTHHFPVNLSPSLFSKNPQPRPQKEVKNTHLLQTGYKCHCFLLFIGSVFWVFLADLRYPFHQNLWNSCFCCLNRLEKWRISVLHLGIPFVFCPFSLWFLTVLFFSFVFDEIAVWAWIWPSGLLFFSLPTYIKCPFSVWGSGLLFLVFICLGFVFLILKSISIVLWLQFSTYSWCFLPLYLPLNS